MLFTSPPPETTKPIDVTTSLPEPIQLSFSPPQSNVAIPIPEPMPAPPPQDELNSSAASAEMEPEHSFEDDIVDDIAEEEMRLQKLLEEEEKLRAAREEHERKLAALKAAKEASTLASAQAPAHAPEPASPVGFGRAVRSVTIWEVVNGSFWRSASLYTGLHFG